MQPQNAYIPISVTEEGIVIFVNDEHPSKPRYLIKVTEDGIVNCVNLLQKLKLGKHVICKCNNNKSTTSW